MELRKLIKTGNSSLTLALPAKWIKSKGLKKGDQIKIFEKNESLILNPVSYSKIEEINIDISNLDRTSATLYIQFIFRQGYNIINITFHENKILHIRKNKKVDTITSIYEISKRLIGSEITFQNGNKITISQITNEDSKDLDKILRRIFILILDVSELFLEAIENKDLKLLEIMDEKHRTINNFSNYYLRLLNKFNIDDKKRLLNYHIISSLEKIIDIYKHNSRLILKNKINISKLGVQFILKINESLKLYYLLYYKFDKKKLFEITKLRNFSKQNLNENLSNFSNEELLILISKKEIPEQLIDLINFPIN